MIKAAPLAEKKEGGGQSQEQRGVSKLTPAGETETPALSSPLVSNNPCETSQKTG